MLLDLNLPDGFGLDLLRERVFPQNTGVVIMTANSKVADAVEAMQLGALDYLVKPFNPQELPVVIERARRVRQSARGDEHRRQQCAAKTFFFGSALAQAEAQLSKVLEADSRVRNTPAPILIQGETGTGKTTIARWLHQRGPRATQPLIEVNCSALPETLAESELFGHERGAFTDARAARMGLFEAAHGGSLFLDELPSLTVALQAKVLTAIEDQQVRRVGANRNIEVDVRIIAATSQDLRELCSKGGFRQDLYHRLDLFRIYLSPLRERGEDIVQLAQALLENICRRHRLPPKQISEIGRKRLLSYRWPGNVRELAHELERSVVFEEGTLLHLLMLPCGEDQGETSTSTRSAWFNEKFVFPETGFSIEEADLQIIYHALKQTKGNLSAAARLLGVPRDYLRYRLERKHSPAKSDAPSAP